MNESSNNAGVIQALAERLQKQRLPRALTLKEKVDRGEPLDSMDIAFLEEVFSDSEKIKRLVDENPEWQDLAVRIIALYKEITSKALENEKRS